MRMAKKPTCSEDSCTLQYRTIDLLRKHLVQVHGKDHPEYVYTFQTEEEFNSWKDSYEAENLVNFRRVKQYTNKNCIFRCNRCYNSRFRARGVITRGEKASGSIMMDVVCTCTLMVFFKHNEIKVTLFPTHYNHDLHTGLERV